ncbi:MAG: hypothetical protein ABJE95_02635 [Byssovorax sp.]
MSRLRVLPGAAIALYAITSGALLLSALASGCGPETKPPVDAGADVITGCMLPFLGDSTKPTEIEIIALKADYTSAPVAEGDGVALLFPVQGGRVIFVGVRARNVDPCGVQLAGAVRDLDTMQLRVDARTINLEATSDGWGASSDADIASFANVPMCPNQWSKTNIYGTKYELEVTITDRAKHKTTKKVAVVPTCAEPENAAECACICKGGYMLGEACDGATTSSSSGSSSSTGGMSP